MSDLPLACLRHTCRVPHAPSLRPREQCPICKDERHYVGRGGQRWTTLKGLAAQGHTNTLRELEPGLWHPATQPATDGAALA